MTRADYEASKMLSADYPFYALIMAAMRRADNDNLEKLKRAFPQAYDELQQRYNAPGGYLPNEREELEANWFRDTV